jgi:hypothetical protein
MRWLTSSHLTAETGLASGYKEKSATNRNRSYRKLFIPIFSCQKRRLKRKAPINTE